MDDESIDHGDDMVVVLFVFLSVSRPILRETSTKMDFKELSVLFLKKWTAIFSGLFFNWL